MDPILTTSGITPFEQMALLVVLGTGISALIYAFVLARKVLGEDPGTPRMQNVSNSIHEGAVAYLNRQMEIVIPIAFVLALVLALTAYLANSPLEIWVGRGIALLFGAACSLAIGQIGLRIIGTRANVRVAQQARAGRNTPVSWGRLIVCAFRQSNRFPLPLPRHFFLAFLVCRIRPELNHVLCKDFKLDFYN
jgi:Na+/H+-translocating membrane pyrophosphatase